MKENVDAKKHARLLEDSKVAKAVMQSPSFLTTENTHEAFANTLRSATPKSASRRTHMKNSSFVKRQMADIARRELSPVRDTK